MKYRRAKNLELIPCPHCAYGQAVNKSKAWMRYNSTKYVKLRKAKAKIKTKKLPIVVRNSTLEAAMLDENWIQDIKPPVRSVRRITLDKFLESKLFKPGLIISMLPLGFGGYLWLRSLDFNHEDARAISTISLLLFLGLLFFALIHIDNKMDEIERLHNQRGYKDYNSIWICLDCKKQFLLEQIAKTQ